MLDRIKNVIAMFKGLEEGTLEGLRYTSIFFVVIDLFLFYWWMEWKSLAIGLFLVTIVFLTIILFLERAIKNKAYDDREDRIDKIGNRLKELQNE